MSREEMMSARMHARELKKRMQAHRGGRPSSVNKSHAERERRTEVRYRIVRLRWLGQEDEADALERGMNEGFA